MSRAPDSFEVFERICRNTMLAGNPSPRSLHFRALRPLDKRKCIPDLAMGAVSGYCQFIGTDTRPSTLEAKTGERHSPSRSWASLNCLIFAFVHNRMIPGDTIPPGQYRPEHAPRPSASIGRIERLVRCRCS